MSDKPDAEKTSSEDLWKRFQDMLANKWFCVNYDELSEREKRSVFSQFIGKVRAKKSEQ